MKQKTLKPRQRGEHSTIVQQYKHEIKHHAKASDEKKMGNIKKKTIHVLDPQQDINTNNNKRTQAYWYIRKKNW